MEFPSLRTATTGAAAPSSTQLSPPKAISDVPTAHCAKTTSSPSVTRPDVTALASAQNTIDIRRQHDEKTPNHRPLAETRRLVLQVVQPLSAIEEAIEHPVGEAEQTKLFAGRRIHGEPECILGVALRGADDVGVAIAPDRALAQQPVRNDPRAAENDRRPPGESDEDRGAGDAAEHVDHSTREEIHRKRQRRTRHAEVEVARDGEIARQRRIFEMAHARRSHACVRQSIVQPRGRAVAELRADGGVNRREDLEHDKQHADERQRRAERRAALNRSDECAHPEGENDR